MSPQPKQPPFDINTEQSVLGAMMLDNRNIDVVSELLSPDDFYREDHQMIYRVILDLHGRGQPSDFITITSALKSSGNLEAAGGLAYVGELANNAPSAFNADSYAKIVRDRSLQRRLICVGGDIAGMGFSPDGRSVIELVDEAQRLVMGVNASDDDGTNAVGELCEEWSREIDRRLNGSECGITLPFTDLTNALGGLEDGDLVIIGGRAGTGKTTFALQVAMHVARTYGDVFGFSLEMTKAQWMTRLVSAVALVDSVKLRKPSLLEQIEWDRVSMALSKIREVSFHINEQPASLDQLRRRARRKQQQLRAKGKRLRAVVIDYLQKAAEHSDKNGGRAEKVKRVSDGLKTLAKELRCPIIAISQTNRDADKRDNRRPRLSDLSEGGIEADADIVIGLYRDELSNPDSNDKGIAEAIILKQRNGPPGTVELEFHGAYSSYADYKGPPSNIRNEQPASTTTKPNGWKRKSGPGLVEALKGSTQ